MAKVASSMLVRFGACVLPVLAGGRAAIAQETTEPALRGLLPDDVLIALEIAAPETAVRELLAAAGSMPAGVPPEVLAPLGIGLTAVSIAIGGDAVEWAHRLFGGGVAIGVEAAPPAARTLLVARPGDLAAARTWCEHHAAGRFAIDGDLLWLSSDAAGVDELRQRTVAPAGRWARVDLGPPRAVRGAIDLAAIRRLPKAGLPALERLGGAARFFGAPVVHALATAEWLRFSLAGGAALVLTAEADASVRDTAFGALLPAVNGNTLPPLPADGVASLRIDRSLRVLLDDPKRFLLPADVLAVQSFLSIADAVDGARSSFVADLLGGLQEPFALHVVPAAPQDGDAGALVAVPGIALVAKVADPAVEPILTRTAQVLITIGNAERMQRGQVPYQLRAQRSERGHGLVAEPGTWRGPGLPPVDHTLCPTLWFEAGFVAIASTRAAAEAVLAVPAAGVSAGDQLMLRGPAVAAALARNRGVLELARMLDEGEGRDTVRRFFDTAIAVSGAVRELSIAIDVDAKTTRLRAAMERVR